MCLKISSPLAGHRRGQARQHQVAPLERVEQLLHPLGLAVQQPCHRARPEDAADHRRRLHDPLLVGRQQVDAGGQHALHGVGDGDVGDAGRGPPAAVARATISRSSISRRTISSRKNGLPSARSRIRAQAVVEGVDVEQQPHQLLRLVGGRADRARCWTRCGGRRPSRAGARSARAGSGIRTALAPGSGRPAPRAGRACAPSAQWMSSITAPPARRPPSRRTGPPRRVDLGDHRPRRQVARAARRDRRRPIVWAMAGAARSIPCRRAQRTHLVERNPGRVGVEHAQLGLGDLGQRPEGDAVAVGQAAAADDAARSAGLP